jgi:hypothetical protein
VADVRRIVSALLLSLAVPKEKSDSDDCDSDDTNSHANPDTNSCTLGEAAASRSSLTVVVLGLVGWGGLARSSL